MVPSLHNIYFNITNLVVQCVAVVLLVGFVGNLAINMIKKIVAMKRYHIFNISTPISSIWYQVFCAFIMVINIVICVKTAALQVKLRQHHIYNFTEQQSPSFPQDALYFMPVWCIQYVNISWDIFRYIYVQMVGNPAFFLPDAVIVLMLWCGSFMFYLMAVHELNLGDYGITAMEIIAYTFIGNARPFLVPAPDMDMNCAQDCLICIVPRTNYRAYRYVFLHQTEVQFYHQLLTFVHSLEMPDVIAQIIFRYLFENDKYLPYLMKKPLCEPVEDSRTMTPIF